MTLRAIRGGCLIRPDTVVSDGGIEIPDYIQRVGRPSGILLQADTHEKDILSALGLRVIVRTAISFSYQGEHFLMAKCDQLLAVVAKDGVVKVIDPIERCQFCKSAGEANMLLDSAGYCCQCKRNKYGEHFSQRQLKVSADEVERFGGSAEDQLNKHNAKGTVISYPGQHSHTGTQADKPKLFVPPARPSMSRPLAQKSEGKIISAASLKRRSPL